MPSQHPSQPFQNFTCLVKRSADSNFLIRTSFWTKRIALGSFHWDGNGRSTFEWLRELWFLSYFLPLIQILITPSHWRVFGPTKAGYLMRVEYSSLSQVLSIDYTWKVSMKTTWVHWHALHCKWLCSSTTVLIWMLTQSNTCWTFSGYKIPLLYHIDPSVLGKLIQYDSLPTENLGISIYNGLQWMQIFGISSTFASCLYHPPIQHVFHVMIWEWRLNMSTLLRNGPSKILWHLVTNTTIKWKNTLCKKCKSTTYYFSPSKQ